MKESKLEVAPSLETGRKNATSVISLESAGKYNKQPSNLFNSELSSVSTFLRSTWILKTLSIPRESVSTTQLTESTVRPTNNCTRLTTPSTALLNTLLPMLLVSDAKTNREKPRFKDKCSLRWTK